MKKDWSGTQLDVLLLEIVSRGAAHGYEIIQRLRDESAGAFDLPEGTVYPSLHRLEKSGELGSRWETVGGRRRRVYEITNVGKTALSSGKRTWAAYSLSVTTVLGATA